ncbi:UNVERIFIED_CONTAM: ABC-2 type transport system permease protein [Acetivibrio alkalicellulosi]
MKGFMYTLYLKTKLDIKSSEVLITYYLVPLIFFGVMGMVFTSTMPEAKYTIIGSMTIFTITMGALIGTPGTIIEYFTNDLRKSFKSAGIPLWTIVLSSLISGFINLIVVSFIIYTLSPLLFDATLPSNLVVYGVGFILFLVATLLIGIILGLTAKSTSKLTMYSQIVFLPSMLLSGIMFPSDMLPKPLEYLGLILPATHGMKILSAESFNLENILILLLFIVIATLIIIFRLNQLKYEDAK